MRWVAPPSAAPRLALALGGAGAALRLWQYCANPSLRSDEANIALNILERSPAELLRPLDYHQVSPPAWLLLEKAAVVTLGEGEAALRLVPLLGSLAALLLVWRVARRALASDVGPLLALGLVALGGPFIDYAGRVKPYATDVAISLAPLALVLAVAEEGAARGRALRLGLVGVLAPWLSYPAIMVVGGLVPVLLVSALRDRDRGARRPLIAVTLACAASAVGSCAWARGAVTPDDMLYLHRFWAGSFPPLPPASLADLAWPIRRLAAIYGDGGFRYPVPGVLLALAGIGAMAVWRRARLTACVLLAPVAVTFVAAAAHVYPIAPRVSLFLLPTCLLLTAAGVEAVGRGWRLAALAAGACTVLAVVGLGRNPPPYSPQSLRPILRDLRETWQAGDRVYVFYGAEKAFLYYARRYAFRPAEYTLGRCVRGDRRVYLRELDAFRGASRLWVVITHARPPLEEDTALLGYLDRIGQRRLTYRTGGGPATRGPDLAWAYLYDLSDPTRLADASAETFPLPSRRVDDLGWSCHPGAEAVRARGPADPPGSDG